MDGEEKQVCDEDRRAFLSKVASVSIAAAFGGAAVLASRAADAQVVQPLPRVAAPVAQLRQQHRILRREALRSTPVSLRGLPWRRVGWEGLAEHARADPDVAVLSLLKLTAEGLVTNQGGAQRLQHQHRGVPEDAQRLHAPGLLPNNQLQLPSAIRTGAIGRRGWASAPDTATTTTGARTETIAATATTPTGGSRHDLARRGRSASARLMQRLAAPREPL